MQEQRKNDITSYLPGVEVAVSLIDGLRHLFHASGVVLLIHGDQFLRELIKLLDLMLVLMELRVERLQTQTMPIQNERVEGQRGSVVKSRESSCRV